MQETSPSLSYVPILHRAEFGIHTVDRFQSLDDESNSVGSARNEPPPMKEIQTERGTKKIKSMILPFGFRFSKKIKKLIQQFSKIGIFTCTLLTNVATFRGFLS